jgi:UDP-N-acetylglucosamine 2-epimerase
MRRSAPAVASDRVMVVIGTRPEAIKLAPVVRELARRRFDVRLCGTGQHERLLDQTLRELGLRPQRHLSVMRRNQTLPALSARLLQAMSRVMTEWRPRLVVVQGDTTSSFIGALSAFSAPGIATRRIRRRSTDRWWRAWPACISPPPRPPASTSSGKASPKPPSTSPATPGSTA